MSLHKNVLEYTYKYGFSHLPSALSVSDIYLALFNVIKDNLDEYHLVIGKPWGAQALYVVLNQLKLQISKKDKALTSEQVIVNPKNGKTLAINEGIRIETLGDCLGFADGIALASDKPVICVVSDAQLQTGYMYEAVNFMIQHSLNVTLIVDHNRMQVRGFTENILSDKLLLIGLERLAIAKDYDFIRVQPKDFETVFREQFSQNHPSILICETIKGAGFKLLEDNPEYHYVELTKELYGKIKRTHYSYHSDPNA